MMGTLTVMGMDDYRSPWQKKQAAERRKEAELQKSLGQPDAADDFRKREGKNYGFHEMISSLRLVLERKGGALFYYAATLGIVAITVVLLYLRSQLQVRLDFEHQEKIRAEHLRVRSESLQVTSEISQYLKRWEKSAELLASTLAEANTRSMALELARIAAFEGENRLGDRNSPLVRSMVSFAFLPDAFDGNDAKFAGRDGYGKTGRMAATFINSGSPWRQEVSRDINIEENLHEEPWYREVVKEQKTYLSPAYLRNQTRVMSFSAPIFRKGHFLGVVCIEDTLEETRRILLQYADRLEKNTPEAGRKRLLISHSWSHPGPLVIALDGTIMLSLNDYAIRTQYRESLGDPAFNSIIDTALEKIRQGADSYTHAWNTNRIEQRLVDCVRFDVGADQVWVLISENDVSKVYFEDSNNIYSTILLFMYTALSAAGIFFWFRRRKIEITDNSEKNDMKPAGI